MDGPNKVQRREKKNKYAKFSKADKNKKSDHTSMDPLDRLMEESQQKNQDLQEEQRRKKEGRASRDPQRLDRSSPSPQASSSDNAVRTRNKRSFPPTTEIDPYDPTTYGFTELGTILGPHGVHGEMKIDAATFFGQERLCPPEPLTRHLKMPNRRSPREVTLLAGRLQTDNIYLVRLEGVRDRDAARKLRGAVLYAREEERPVDLHEGEYLLSDLVGCEVFLDEAYEGDDDDDDDNEEDLAGAFVGTVVGIVLADEMCSIPGLGSDLLEISLPRSNVDGVRHSFEDELVLVPFVKQLVPRVDQDAREIYVDPPPGLLDLTYVRQDNVKIKGYLPPGR